MTNEESERLVGPVAALLASVVLSALLIYDAVQIENGEGDDSGRRKALAEAIRAIAEGIGVTGSIVVASVAVVASSVWLVLRIRSIRAARAPR